MLGVSATQSQKSAAKKSAIVTQCMLSQVWLVWCFSFTLLSLGWVEAQDTHLQSFKKVVRLGMAVFTFLVEELNLQLSIDIIHY